MFLANSGSCGWLLTGQSFVLLCLAFVLLGLTFELLFLSQQLQLSPSSAHAQGNNRLPPFRQPGYPESPVFELMFLVNSGSCGCCRRPEYGPQSAFPAAAVQSSTSVTLYVWPGFRDALLGFRTVVLKS